MYSLASILKAFVRDLPQPLIDPSSYKNLKKIFEAEKDGLESFTKFIVANFLKVLDRRRLVLLQDLMRLMNTIAQLSDVNQMTSLNLAVVWTPNMIRHDTLTKDMQNIKASNRLIFALIEHFELIFRASDTMYK